VLRAETDLDGARSAYEAALRIGRRNGDNSGMAGAILGLACLYRARVRVGHRPGQPGCRPYAAAKRCRAPADRAVADRRPRQQIVRSAGGTGR